MDRDNSRIEKVCDEDDEGPNRARPRGELHPRAAKRASQDAHPHGELVSIPYTTAASQFLYGRSQIEAALHAARRQLYKLYVYGGANRQNLERDEEIERLARNKGVETVIVQEDGLKILDKMSNGRPHNGYILEASPLPQRPVSALGAVSAPDAGKRGFHIVAAHQSAEDALVNGTQDFIPSSSQTHQPLVVVLDQILDPGNLGAILRSVSFLGASAVVTTKRNSATLTPVALKASSGAAESLTLLSVESMLPFLTDSRENGWKVYAAAPLMRRPNSSRYVDVLEVEAKDPLARNPCILLIGNEGEGLAKSLKSKADYEVSIPNMAGSTLVDSLNVSVASALLCSSFMKGQEKQFVSSMKGQKEKVALF